MKKTIAVTVVILAIGGIAVAEERITIISPDVVEIQEVHYDKQVDGKEIIVNQTSYNLQKVHGRMAQISSAIAKLEAIDPVKMRADQLKDLEGQKSLLLEIQAKLIESLEIPK